MKINNWNKFGGTEMRTNKPIVHYYSILCWIKDILDNTSDKQKLDLDWWEKAFRDYVRKEGIYTYKDSKINNRFRFILGHLQKWGFLTYNKTSISLALNIDIVNDDCIEEFFLKMLYLNWNEFHSMIDFIFNQEENSKINIQKLIWAFSVFDYEIDNFENLYNMSESEILEKIWSRSNIISVEKIFKKQPNEIELFKNISAHILKKEMMVAKTFNDILSKIKSNISNFNYLKTLLKINKKTKKVDYLSLINKYIAEHSNEEFLKDLKFLSIKKNIEKEYKDMFIRWMYELKIINNKKAHEITKKEILQALDLNKLSGLRLENIHNQKIYNLDHFNSVQYPFTFEETKKILSDIQKYNFEKIKQYNKELKIINNPTIAEYIVNLFFAYKLKLSISEFRKSCNTNMDINLFPSFTAKGGVADFEWYDEANNIQYVVETTILKNSNEIIKLESYPIINHTKKIIQNRNIDPNTKLFFINHFNFNNEENKKDVDDVFSAIFNKLLEHVKNKFLYKMNFKQLAELKEIQ